MTMWIDVSILQGPHRTHGHKPEPQGRTMLAPTTRGTQPLACVPGSSLSGSALCMLLEVQICVSSQGSTILPSHRYLNYIIGNGHRYPH